MKKLILLSLLLSVFSEQRACPSALRRAYNYILPPQYQQTLVDTASRLASTIGVEQVHILLPQIISAGISIDELMRHEVPHPLIASILAQTATALPAITAQGALCRHAAGRTLSFRDLAHGVGMGLCSGLIIREGAHLFFIIFPNSWISSLGFVALSLTITPVITERICTITGNRAQRLWNWCRSRRRLRNDTDRIDVVVYDAA